MAWRGGDNGGWDYGRDRHWCWGKIHAVMERVGMLLSHDEINFLCESQWECQNQAGFYDHMRGLNNEQLKIEVKKAKDAVKKKGAKLIEERTGEKLNADEIDHMYNELQKDNTVYANGEPRWLGILSDINKMSDEELKKRIKNAQDAEKERIKNLRRRLGITEQMEEQTKEKVYQ